jgi:hypothetical protein
MPGAHHNKTRLLLSYGRSDPATRAGSRLAAVTWRLVEVRARLGKDACPGRRQARPEASAPSGVTNRVYGALPWPGAAICGIVRAADHNPLPVFGVGVSVPGMPATVVDLASTSSAPPANLGEAGIRFWESITAEYDISDAGGRALLEQAAFAYDRAERLRALIDRDGEIFQGANGPREHPGLRGELAARALVCRTLQKLGINLEPVRLSSGRPSGPGWRGRE